MVARICQPDFCDRSKGHAILIYKMPSPYTYSYQFHYAKNYSSIPPNSDTHNQLRIYVYSYNILFSIYVKLEKFIALH